MIFLDVKQQPLLRRIQDAAVESFGQNGKEPTSAYLGIKEFYELMLEMETEPKRNGEKKKLEVYGLEIVLVMERTYFRVV